MAKRYYICRVLGDGTSPQTAYYPELREYLYANHPNEPRKLVQVFTSKALLWCLMKYDLSQAAHDDVMANLTGIYSFPETGLDRTMTEIPWGIRDAMQAKLENIGFRFGWVTGSTTLRQIVRYVAWSLQLAAWAEVTISQATPFDLDTRIVEIPQAKRQLIRGHMENLEVPVDWITGQTTIFEICQKINFNDDLTKRLFGTPPSRPWLFDDEDEF
jgi:hypothetical protein